MNPSPSHSCPVQSLALPPGDRWSLRLRLEELDIPATCPNDGTLRVEIPHPAALVQLWSVVQQFTTTRQEQLHWLERCWRLRPPKSPPGC